MKKKVGIKPAFKIETKLSKEGYNFICGLDEVGMSCLAGPVYAAAVIFDSHPKIKGINDSKLLSPEQREKLAPIIKERAVSWGIGKASVDLINKVNIFHASKIAMLDAISNLNIIPDYLLVDGKFKLNFIKLPQQALVKGDRRSISIAAASIIAKVARDNFMCELAEKFPEYGWQQNKGYPTKFHRTSIKECGITLHHRLNFAGVIKQGKWRT